MTRPLTHLLNIETPLS